MQRCATCGTTENLRLYFVERGARVERRWWCPECWFSARRLRASVDVAPVWIERVALNRLPMKPLETTYPEHDGPTLDRRPQGRGPAGRRADRLGTRYRA